MHQTPQVCDSYVKLDGLYHFLNMNTDTGTDEFKIPPAVSVVVHVFFRYRPEPLGAIGGKRRCVMTGAPPRVVLMLSTT
jgi:hypothetical protein